ncbi:unnamed protein product [Prorocentrum cordatum]|uniref:DNA (cytosine-5-)-methyltransferase n=1 Tax=Prorocentrum cordatum TaxID=2364126 RepID=A0ABN9WBB5_9DINO|nr:unnamed protein product [Polarella glacialis]
MLDSAKVGGVPQHRQRIYLIGILKTVDDGTFEWPHEYKHGGMKTILDPKETPFKMVAPKATQTTACNNLIEAIEAIKKLSWDPTKKACVIDIDSTKMNWRHDESLCLTASRGRTGGYYVSNRGRRLRLNECLRLQAHNPKLIKIGKVSVNQMMAAAGNAMTVSVIERLMLRALPAAQLADSRMLQKRWEDLASATATLASMR